MNHPIFRRFQNILEPYSPESKAPVFEWEVEGADLLVRRQNDNVEIVWAFLGQSRLAQKFQNPRTLRTSGNKVRGAFHARRLWRMWPLANGETAFFRAEFGLLRFAGERELVEWKMPRGQFQSALEAFEASSEVVSWLFERLNADKDSDLHAARKWRDLHRDPWASLEFARGSQVELENVMRSVAHLFFDPQKIEFWSWAPSVFSLYGKENPLPLKTLFPKASLEWNSLCQNAAERIGAVIEEEFEVRVESARWRGYDSMGNPSPRRWPILRFSSPTMHERIEAQEFLREWLNGKMPDGEIKSLF